MCLNSKSWHLLGGAPAASALAHGLLAALSAALLVGGALDAANVGGGCTPPPPNSTCAGLAALIPPGGVPAWALAHGGAGLLLAAAPLAARAPCGRRARAAARALALLTALAFVGTWVWGVLIVLRLPLAAAADGCYVHLYALALTAVAAPWAALALGLLGALGTAAAACCCPPRRRALLAYDPGASEA